MVDVVIDDRCIVDSIVPPLKKVSKYQTQLEKMRQWTYKLAKMDMRGGLKPVKKEIDLGEKEVSHVLNRNSTDTCFRRSRARKTNPSGSRPNRRPTSEPRLAGNRSGAENGRKRSFAQRI